MSGNDISPQPTPSGSERVNLRRPDIMVDVQSQVESHYRSQLVQKIRAAGSVIYAPGLTIRLAKEFGFCYGVERAINLAYASRKVYPDQPIYILGEIIHNPDVNDHLREMGIRFLSGKEKTADIKDLKAGDIVIIPAFGTQLATMDILKAKGCRFVDTTCGDVMSVWKRVRQYANENFTSLIHGKAWHEETLATSSRATAHGTGHYLVVFTLDDTDFICNYILKGGDKKTFLEKFKGACSPDFDPDVHLEAIGVANQTTMLRNETEEFQRKLRNAMVQKYGEENIEKHFKRYDTICGATQERQNALRPLLKEPMDLLLVLGGYNSSNTSHLAEMGEAVLPTYFIKGAEEIISEKLIRHYDFHLKSDIETSPWLPTDKEAVTIGITAGASCPNNIIENTIHRLAELKNLKIEDFIH